MHGRWRLLPGPIEANSPLFMGSPGVPPAAYPELKGRLIMLYTIAVILIVAWLLGLVSSYTIGGFIHILLVVALVMVLVRVIQGTRVG
jgi:hypothetical protein